MFERFHELRRSWPTFWKRLDAWFYVWVAAIWVLVVAHHFYGAMAFQLRTSTAWMTGKMAWGQSWGRWSAPLDDVFIHFDFARSIVRGHPFEWVDGNGYSSGGTSLLYPFVLALGYPLGFRGLALMHFAAVIACVSIFGTLLAVRRAFGALPLHAKYVLPFVLLSVGALDWSFFSGMEVAFFLAVWALAFVAWDDVVCCLEPVPSGGAEGRLSKVEFRRLLALGFTCFLITATRPEAVSTVAVLSLDVAGRVFKRRGWRSAVTALVTSATPGALVVIGQGIANKLLTGDFAAAGALVKLEVNNPFLSRADVVRSYFSNLEYEIMRVTEHHFSSLPWIGWVVWLLAFLALLPRITRRYAAVCWWSVFGWLLTVAFNGQVRWQNERYVMPAVAWLLIAAALGLGWLLSWGRWVWNRACLLRLAGVAFAGGAVALFCVGQARPFVDQTWFFGRASRNIFEQHVQAGWFLRNMANPHPHRVLVGDAGAIPFVADLPALDIIGLGGTHRLPFAQASVFGVGASLELIQHMSPADRPDTYAIFPSWWGVFPMWFADAVEARIPVRGNVICGDHTKAIYHADLSSLEDAERPLSKLPAEQVRDSLDFADLISESRHGYRQSVRRAGWVEMKKLPHPEHAEQDLFDAGRITGPGLRLSFRLGGLTQAKTTRCILRVVPAQSAQVAVTVGGQRIGVFSLEPRDTWTELSLPVPASLIKPSLDVVFETLEGGPTLYHLWVVQEP